MLRRILQTLALSFSLVLAAAAGGCEDDPPASTATTHVCPMHPEQQGGPGDKCSECGMDLVPKERVGK